MIRTLVISGFLFLSFFAASAQITTIASGNWTTPGTWSCACVPSDASGTITITAGRTVTITTTISADQLTVAADGILNINSGGKLTLKDGAGNDLTQVALVPFVNTNNGRVNVNAGGILENQGQISPIQASLVFASGSEYQHNQNGGQVTLATWQSGSTVRITGWTSTATPAAAFLTSIGQTFHHFIWDCAAQSANVMLGGALTAINGDLTFNNTSAARRVFLGLNGAGTVTNTIGGSLIVKNISRITLNASGTYTLNVLGNIDFSSAATISAAGEYVIGAIGAATLNVNGDFKLGSGRLLINSSTGTGNLNVKGNFTINGGAIGKTAGTGTIAFNGNKKHQYVFTAGTFDSNAIDYSVAALDTLNLSTFGMGTAASTFTVNGNVLLGSTNPSGAIIGNILPTTRTFNSGSTITYSGTAAQFIGSSHPNTAGVNTTINNVNNVSLASSATIGGNLTLLNGNLVIGSNTLTLGANLIPNTHTLAVTTNSNITINGTGALGILPLSGGTTINNLTMNRTPSGSVTMNSDLTIAGTFTQTAGLLDLNGHTLTISGPYLGSGSLGITAASSLLINGLGAVPAVTFTGTGLNTLTFNKPSATLAATGTFAIDNLNLTAGTFSNPATVSMSPGGVITVIAGALTTSPGSTGTYDVVYNNGATIGTGPELPSSTTLLQNLTVTGGGDVNLASNVTINGNLILNNGNLNAGSRTITLLGDFSGNAGGTFNSSTLVFAGLSSISGGSVPQLGHVVVLGGATLNLPDQLSVARNITFDPAAVINPNDGTITLSGSAPQDVSAGGLKLNNLTVTQSVSSTVNLSTGLSLLGTLDITSVSVLASNGNLRLISTSDGTTGNGRIASLLGGAGVTGVVTAERFMSNEGELYRYISSPVTTATVEQLQDSIPVTGSFPETSTCGGCTAFPSLYYYNAATAQYVAYPTVNNDDVLMPGVGYAAFIYQDDIPNPVTLALKGDINQGNIPLPIVHNTSVAESWNLVGNPYPSSINWDVPAGWSKTNINGSIAVHDNGDEAPGFRYWNGMTGSGVGDGLDAGDIAAGQAFWVQTMAASPVLTIHEEAKIANTGSFYRQEEVDAIKIKLSNGTLNDMAVLQIHPNAKPGFDKLDASKRPNDRFDFSIKSPDGKRYAINSIKEISCDALLTLDIAFTKNTDGSYVMDPKGNYDMSFKYFGGIFPATEVALTDKFTGTKTNLHNDLTYSFSITSDPASLASDRFKLQFTSKHPNLNLTSTASTAICGDEHALVQVKNTESAYSYYLTKNGEAITDRQSGNGSDLSFNFNGGVLTNGDNKIDIVAEGACGPEVMTMPVHITQNQPSRPAVVGGSHCREGSITLSASGASSGSGYRWYESADAPESISDQVQFSTPPLTESASYYATIVDVTGCESARQEVVATIVNYDDASITEEEGDILRSNSSTGNQWYFNNVAIAGAVNQSYRAWNSGVYRLETSYGTCSTTTEINYVVTGIDELSKSEVYVYPNPVATELRIDLHGDFTSVDGVFLVNASGQQMEKRQTEETTSGKTAAFQVSEFSDGLYFVQFTLKGKLYSYKVLKNSQVKH